MTPEHRRWLAQQRFPDDLELVYGDLLATLDGLADRRARLDEALQRSARRERYWPTVSRLRAFRGVDTTSRSGSTSSSATGPASGAPRRRRVPRSGVLGLDQTGQRADRPCDHKPGRGTPADCWSKQPGAASGHRPSGIILQRRQQGIRTRSGRSARACNDALPDQRAVRRSGTCPRTRRTSPGPAELACFLMGRGHLGAVERTSPPGRNRGQADGSQRPERSKRAWAASPATPATRPSPTGDGTSALRYPTLGYQTDRPTRRTARTPPHPTGHHGHRRHRRPVPPLPLDTKASISARSARPAPEVRHRTERNAPAERASVRTWDFTCAM